MRIYNINMEAEKPFDDQAEQQKTRAEEVLGNMPSFEEHIQNTAEKPHRKTFEEKANEKGYYKNENGVWAVHISEFGFDEWDEPVEGFKLDEEYPDLADRTEALAEQYHVKFDDNDPLKKTIYENANRLTDASDEHLKDMFGIASNITFSGGNTEERLVGYSSDELRAINGFIHDFYTATEQQMPNKKLVLDQQTMNISEYIVRDYSPKLFEGNFLDKLSEYSAKALQDSENGYLVANSIKKCIQGIGINEGSGKYFGEYMDYANELVGDKQKIANYDTKFSLLGTYVWLHGVDEKTVSGFRDVIFPLIEQGDTEIEAITRGGNAYGTYEGTYGIADYTEECLLSTFNPGDINKLVRIYHEIPTSDVKKFEQNRNDAIRLAGTIIGGRDFIHDERIGTNEVLSAIKDYYDHRNDNDAEKYKDKLVELEGKYQFDVLPEAFNLEAYEKTQDFMPNPGVADEGNPGERAIDILNRLVENTRPNLLKAPTTKYPELNGLMENIAPIVNEQTGEVRVDMDEIGAAVKTMNDLLLEHRGEQGVFPSTISAIAFIDKMSTYALRNESQKEIKELVFDPVFKEMVRFSQLTSSLEYDERDFEKKYQQMSSKISEAYKEDGVDSSIVAEGYQILSQNILNNMQALGRKYASKKVTTRFRDAIWSGNLSDELIGLFQRV